MVSPYPLGENAGMPRPPSRIAWASLIVGVLVLTTWGPDVGADEPEDTGLTVTVEPQLIDPGTRPALSEEAGYGVHVEVPGAPAGHDVRLEVWSDGGWVTEDMGVTDGSGQVRLVSTAGSYGRVVTEVDAVRTTVDVDPVSKNPPLLYWAEEFNDDSLADQWLVVDQPDNDSCTTSGASAIAVSDGVLALSVDEDADGVCTRPGKVAHVNGHIILRSAVAYGTTAARIRFPRSRGVRAQFWLQPGDPGLPWVMDDAHEGVVVAGTAGTGRDPRLDTSVNRVVDGAVEASRRVTVSADASNDGRFHVYSVEWTPETYVFKIDGETIRSVGADGPVPPMTIALAVLPRYPRIPSAPEERTMYVDWLRVWGP